MATTRSPDGRALLISTWTSAAFAVVALVWGLATGSQLIVFDGLYSFASVGLSLAAVLALRTARKGPDERYPWGREAWEPLTVVVKAAALAGLSIYALVSAVGEILAGGRDIDVGWALAYGVVATVAGAVVSLILRRRARAGGSDLVRAEAAEWVGDTLLSVAVLAGFVVALVLEQTGHSDLARYVDPAMVALVSAAFLPVPAKLVVSGFRELLMMSPAPHLQARIAATVSEVERTYRFAESFVRASKVGGRLDVAVEFVVDDDSTAQTVHQFDDVRADLEARFEALDQLTSMSVGFTADRRWAL
ncbi:cation diffusion facilitator family transporter [Pseudonocardia alaniniphila]|uniref:Cation diffusion facilitator family transporter n=1 Tax=Pseudonocardia alaniniphila TaxID=75291 RepID=A0ABS9TEJ4_9PSEU|nr:cation diffusion facilitator family transporter [Pseudonocardia alaniniphila]MCH6166947.1 cation diffusion facilitator family transporter [Pseudonocardia alaniniphila]